jgi:hypothetical protein
MDSPRFDRAFVLRNVDLNPPPAKETSIRDWPHKPVLNQETVPWLKYALGRRFVRMVFRYQKNFPLYTIENDQILRLYPTQDRFWEVLGNPWTKENLEKAWLSAWDQSYKAEDWLTAQLSGSTWYYLLWRKYLTLLQDRNNTFENLPADHSSEENEAYPFPIRVLITEAVCLKIQQRIDLWEESLQDNGQISRLIRQARNYSWGDVVFWREKILLWTQVEALSYEDGDFLKTIEQQRKTTSQIQRLKTLYQEYGIQNQALEALV